MSDVSTSDVSARVRAAVHDVLPGLSICLIIAAAAQFLSEHYGAPQMLFALLLGMTVHFLTEDQRCAAGIEFGAKKILRIGVALLGFRITIDQVIDLGLSLVLLVTSGVIATILFGLILARTFNFSAKFGVLSGGAVGICGASAALAISSVLPKEKDHESNTIFTVITVTALSTFAMVLYPMIGDAFGLNDFEIGIFLGGTIHDVAQVVGAGYSVSVEAGDTSTIMKLFRVALLVPIVLTIGMAFRFALSKAEKAEMGQVRPPFPVFLLFFCAFVAFNSSGHVPPLATDLLTDASRWCLVTAIAALGIKTSVKALLDVGTTPILMMVAQTIFLAAWVLIGLMTLG